MNKDPKYQDKLDPALKRKLVSHSLFTRTIYEIQNNYGVNQLILK